MTALLIRLTSNKRAGPLETEFLAISMGNFPGLATRKTLSFKVLTASTAPGQTYSVSMMNKEMPSSIFPRPTLILGRVRSRMHSKPSVKSCTESKV